MPLGYNISPPTPSTKNTINSTTMGTFTGFNIRDYLLNRNLLPVYPTYLGLLPSPQIGEPVLDTSVNNNINTTPFGLPLEIEGPLREQIAVLPNRFKNTDSTALDLMEIDFITQTIPYPNSTFPNGTQSYPTGSNPDIYNYGIMGRTIDAGYRKDSTIKNMYLDTTKQLDMADWISLNNSTTTQLGSYTDEYGGLNLGGSPGIQAANVIGSVLNGQGLGLAKGGIVTNFDLRSSLAGRVLGASGLINDTKLGMIGGQQLALALANNAAFNVEQDILGSLNVQDNVLSLIKGNGLAGFRPNYQITVPSSTFGKVADYTSRILGFTLPKSYLDNSGSIFQSENGGVGNIDRANAMLLNTGNGQLTALIASMVANINGTTSHDSPKSTYFRSGYAPGFQNHKGEKQIDGNQIYAFGKEGTIRGLLDSTGGAIPNLSYHRIGQVEDSGFVDFGTSGYIGDSYVSSNIKNPTFTWTSDPNSKLLNSIPDYRPVTGEKKSLLTKTQTLFNSAGMRNIISTKGDMGVTPSQIQTAVVGGGISHGNAVMKSENFDANGRYISSTGSTADGTYCRSWTTFDRYDSVAKLVRKRGLDTTVPYRLQSNGSVLGQNGFVKIAPYSTDSVTDPKKFMFSIENLAWYDNVPDLMPIEKGPGDLITGKNGRIMWFPPYDINFSENTTANWETNNFIGRGESIYTYNNTERSGTLSFKLIVDHPSYVNSFRGTNGPDDHYVASFFAGCVDPSSKFRDKLTVSEISTIDSSNLTKSQLKSVTQQDAPNSGFDVYFPNDIYTYIDEYENGMCGSTPINYLTGSTGEGCGIGRRSGQVTSTTMWNDTNNLGLNSGVPGSLGKVININGDTIPYSGYSDNNLLDALDKYLNERCPNCIVTVNGYASEQGKGDSNISLAKLRAEGLVSQLKNRLFTSQPKNIVEKKIKVGTTEILTDSGCIKGSGQDVSSIGCKKVRKATIIIKYDPNSEPKNSTTNPDPVIGTKTITLNTKITNRFYTEANYFDELIDTDAFIFDKFRDKIKYFHPAFHSSTPEGLNSRLTFLQQCTRQGPTLQAQGATNLAFGRPPVCILRIGDFYNTKIIIDNIGVDYEPLVWDLNPEGIGVQPMIANVSMTFKFIGGSTLMGPINKLQNALSFNYYANTQVYDPRADYIAKGSDINIQIDNRLEVAPDYNIHNMTTETPNFYSQYINGVKTLSQSEIDTLTPIIDEIAGADDAALNQVLPEQPSSTPILTGFKYDKSTSTKSNDYWSLSVRLSVANGSGNWSDDAKILITGHYSLAVYTPDWSEYYEIKLDDQLLMEQLINPMNISNYFRVPIKSSSTNLQTTGGGVGGTTGITDKIGKQNVILALKTINSDESPRNIQVQTIKLK